MSRENWTSFEKYLITRIDKIEDRLRPLEVRVYGGVIAILIIGAILKAVI